MPLALVGRTKDAVVAVPASADWRTGVRRFLGTLTDDEARIARHFTLLEDRLSGRVRWTEELAGASLADGRPMPASRRYAELLMTEGRLPLYDVGTLRFSLDLHNPGNEAGVPEYDPNVLELALVADVSYFSALAPGSVFPHTLGFEEQARRRAAHGALLGRLVARLADATGASFAYADIGATGWVVSMAQRPEMVVHTAPEGVRPWHFLWSISAWSEDVLRAGLGERVEERLERLALDEPILSRVDQVHRPHYRIERRRLASGALFLQYRFLFGSEGRGERAAIDTPLAQRAGLRSTNLLFRA